MIIDTVTTIGLLRPLGEDDRAAWWPTTAGTDVGGTPGPRAGGRPARAARTSFPTSQAGSP